MDVSEICEIIEDLSYNTSPGLDGITNKHMMVADRQLPVFLAVLMSAILIHGYIPKTMLKYVLFLITRIKISVSMTGLTID